MTDVPNDQAEAGKALVRELLIAPLQAAGLRRAKGQSEKAQADSLTHLVGQLDHMSADNLRTLADVLLDHAAAPGPGQGVWPAEVLIKGFANGLQPRPFEQLRLVTSWFASIEGPQAEAGGYLVQLFRFLCEKKRPVLPLDWRDIKAQAEQDRRHLAMITERRSRGAESDDDRKWHAAYLADEREARGYVDAGRTKRGQAA